MIGFDYLGMGHRLWPTKHSIALTPAGSALGVFDSTFGPVLPALRKHLMTGKFPAVRVHLWWSNIHKIAPLEVVRKRAPVYEELARRFPNVKVYLSHSCEYDEPSREEVRKRVELVRELAPSCIPVNACWRGATVEGVLTERHGADARGDIVSTDGENIYDIDAQSWVEKNKNCELTFLWGHRFNLREIGDPGQKPPAPKDRTAAPGPEYIRAVARLGREIGPVPTPTFGGKIVPIEKPFLYKPFAEDSQGVGDARENKPCLIIKASVAGVQIVACNGTPVGRLMRGGSFAGGLTRFYSGLPKASNEFGAAIGERARKLSGSEYVWFKVGNTYFGPVHPAFREGYFR